MPPLVNVHLCYRYVAVLLRHPNLLCAANALGLLVGAGSELIEESKLEDADAPTDTTVGILGVHVRCDDAIAGPIAATNNEARNGELDATMYNAP